MIEWLPELSGSTHAFARVSYGGLLLATLLWALPQGRRFFVSERSGGYIESSPWRDRLHSAAAYPVVMAVWLCCSLLIILDRDTLAAAVVNACLCRHFFVRLRWKGALRGMGAPGYMTYWLGVAILLIEITTRYAPAARQVTLLALQIDFALIILSAGLYKVSAGFAQNEGMDLGLANPAWGYWWRGYMAMAPSHWLLRTLNHLAWFSEVSAALLLLFPPTRTVGGLLIIVTFAFIATQIRLGTLCEMVMACGVLYFAPGSAPDRLIAAVTSTVGVTATPVGANHPWASIALTIALLGYAAVLPFVHVALFFNVFAKRPLPGGWQRRLERYTNFFGIIVWRVFSSDLVNFYVRIFRCERATGRRAMVSNYGIRGGFRFSHVGESIAVTCVFTTLKYYATNAGLFEQRLLRYARTLPCPADCELVFEYVSLLKIADRFEAVPVMEYAVDVRRGSIRRTALRPDLSVHGAHAGSPLHEAAVPGSYVPLAPAPVDPR